MKPAEFGKKWIIRGGFEGAKYEKPDTVFKYSNQNYIDQFFETGFLKLGTFMTFKETEDNIRGDVQEGTNEYLVWNKDRTHKITLRRKTGKENTMFCTSAKRDLQLLGTRFGCDGCFMITNTVGFAYEISKVIKGFVLGMEGPAIYTENGQTNFFTEKYAVPDFNKNTPMLENFKTFDLISKINFDLYFSKRQEPYAIEDEYRFVWLLDSVPNEEELIVCCPVAVRFCQKVT